MRRKDAGYNSAHQFLRQKLMGTYFPERLPSREFSDAHDGHANEFFVRHGIPGYA